MMLVRLASLIGVSLLVMALNVGLSVLYMVVYGHLVNPGHPQEYYQEHIKIAAPYCSIVAGMPLLFLAGFWVAGWSGASGTGTPLGAKAALVVWLGYAIIDIGVLLAAGMSTKIAVLCAVSLFTKLGAAYLGGIVAVHKASQGALVGTG